MSHEAESTQPDAESVLCKEPISLADAIPVIKKIIKKDVNSREQTIELLQIKGATILGNLLKADGLTELPKDSWDAIFLLSVLIIRYCPASSLCFLVQSIPDRATQIDMDSENGHIAAATLSRVMEAFIRKLISDAAVRFPFTTEDKTEKLSWQAELACIRPVVILLLTTITTRQGNYASSTEVEPMQEQDKCSLYINMLALLLIFEAGKRVFVEADGFTTLMMIAAQTQSIPVVTATLSAFHSCVFNLIDSVNDELDTLPVSATKDTEAITKKTTVYNLVVDAFAFVRPHELVNSIYERFYRPIYIAKKLVYTEAQLEEQLEELTFSIVLLFHDCMLPETAGFATQTNMLFVAQYIASIAGSINITKPELWQSDGTIVAFNMKVKGGIEALMRLISLYTETPMAIKVLINGAEAKIPESEAELGPKSGNGAEGTQEIEILVPKNMGFIRAVLNAIVITDCPTLAGTLLSFVSLLASYTCCSNQRLVIPLEPIYYERILLWISAYGSYILSGRPDNVQLLQRMEDACLALVCLVEGADASDDSETGNENTNADTDTDVKSKRDEIWTKLSLRQEAHGILMLAVAMSVVKGLVPSLTGLLSVISCLMSTNGYFIRVLDVFKDKKEEICKFLVSLCADLTKQGAFCYAVCNSILKGMSTMPEVFSTVDPNELAEAIIPLGFSNDDDGIVMKIVRSYKEIPPVIKQSCQKILAIMDAIDGDDVETLVEGKAGSE